MAEQFLYTCAILMGAFMVTGFFSKCEGEINKFGWAIATLFWGLCLSAIAWVWGM